MLMNSTRHAVGGCLSPAQLLCASQKWVCKDGQNRGSICIAHACGVMDELQIVVSNCLCDNRFQHAWLYLPIQGTVKSRDSVTRFDPAAITRLTISFWEQVSVAVLVYDTSTVLSGMPVAGRALQVH